MNSINAGASGQFGIGGTAINRLGYGAMRITGPGVWGPPSDREAALATLRRLPGLSVNFIDTADSYGPDVSEELIREALHPYRGLLVATKGGFTRPGPDQWIPNGHPNYLIAQAKGSLRKLGVEQIDLWQLHRIDPRVPRDEQFGAIRQLLDDGVIRHAGLSEVSVADIEAARRVFPVATVQNRYNLVDRHSEDVVAYCAVNSIGFIPWFPLAAGRLTEPAQIVDRVAKRHGATSGQVALAWLLQHSRVILPIPGRAGLRTWKKTWRPLVSRWHPKKSTSLTPQYEGLPVLGPQPISRSSRCAEPARDVCGSRIVREESSQCSTPIGTSTTT